MRDLTGDTAVARIDLYLDDAPAPFRTVVPPASLEFDTAGIDDGAHLLRLVAYDAAGNVGRRSVPFVVQNGPGITLTGLRAHERVSGRIALELNAFGGNEPFDAIRAESSGPIPVWTWVMIVVFGAWAAWYGLAAFGVPSSYADTPTYAKNPLAAAAAPMTQAAPTKYSGGGAAAGFDYAASGGQLYVTNCAACHGAAGAGVPGAFPSLIGDPVVSAKDPAEQVHVILRGLHGKRIRGTSYGSQMPAFPQLSDADVAAIVDHERTSWGNHAPIITPDVVKRAR